MKDVIIVFGAGGFIGRNLVATLSRRGMKVIALSRILPASLPDGVEALAGEYAQPEEFHPLLARARAVIHVASSTTPGLSAGRPLNELEANLRPTLALLTAMQEAPHCDLLYVSSGGTLYGQCLSHGADELDPIAPRSYYGAGKAAAENFVSAAAAQYGIAATVLRPSNLYGPGQTPRTGFGIIATAFEHIRAGSALTIWGDGSSVRDYLYIDDFLRLCLSVLDHPMPGGLRTFNVASGDAISLNELIAYIRSVTGAPLPVIYDATRSVDIAAVRIDATAARKTFDWVPQIGLVEGLRRTWHWRLEQD